MAQRQFDEMVNAGSQFGDGERGVWGPIDRFVIIEDYDNDINIGTPFSKPISVQKRPVLKYFYMLALSLNYLIQEIIKFANYPLT